MEAVAWRKLQEATADMTKGLGTFYKELRKNGFSRNQAFTMAKDFMILTAGTALRKTDK